jgi:thiol-disulfide isomerase/thioredoxin
MRKALVLLVMIVGIALLLWSGWHNLRERKLAMERLNATHAALIPEKDAGQSQQQIPSDILMLTGKVAPAFQLTSIDGKKVSLGDYKGRPVLVNFWATWCAPCKLEMPWFEEFRKQYAAQGFEILGVTDDADAGKDVIGKAAQKAGVSYPILLADDKVEKAYGGAEGFNYLPMSFYVDRNGVVVEETAGLGTKDEIEANIKKVIASGNSGNKTVAGGE